MLVEIEAFWGKDCINTERALQDVDDGQVTAELMLNGARGTLQPGSKSRHQRHAAVARRFSGLGLER